ncbi:MAG: TonB-dependent hemoglobin/transferrin/lactoferrin family receptor [Burkholderiaceae bacterium]|nr:TonB-dependent hemoglobin/transferrin/lactoferrin family receptor [Burkholderiaceae bacterium]
MIKINHVARLAPIAVAVLAAWPSGAWSQSVSVAQVPDASLREVVVSGSRHEQFLEDLAVSVDVIGEKKIEINQIEDIRDVARDLPNVSVKRAPVRFANTGAANSTGRDGNSGFNIRGLGGNRVLMMVDGIRVPHSYVFGANAYGRDYLSIDLIKRIEIVRGPASALYGSDAMAGLVNFITYDPGDFLKLVGGEGKTVGGRAAVGWSGDDNAWSLSGTIAGRASDTVEWLLTASGTRANAVETQGTNDSPDTSRTTANPLDQRNNALMAKVMIRPDASQKHLLTLEHVGKKTDVNLLSSRTPLPWRGSASAIAGAIVDEQADSTMSRDRFTWDARYMLNSGWADNLQTLVGLQYADSAQNATTDRNTLPDRVRNSSYKENGLQLSAQADKLVEMTPSWGKQRVTYGLEYLTSKISNLSDGVNPLPPEVFPLKRFPDTRESSIALYAQAEWVDEQWSVTPGLRVDWFDINVRSQDLFYPPAKLPARSLTGSAISPKLGVIYRPQPNWNVYGNYAGGFRAPNANQVNGYYENMAEQVVIVPNPDLKPETSRTIELGTRGRWGAFNLTAAAFYGQYDNLIVDNVLQSGSGVPGDPKLFQTVNADKAVIQGFEIQGAWDWGPVAGGRLTTPVSYGQAKGRNTTTGQPLNSIDPAKLVVGVNYEAPAWTLRLDIIGFAAKKLQDIDSGSLVKPPNTQISIPGGATADLYGQWRIRKDLRLNVGLINLTDARYWQWSDVQGLPSSTPVLDAYSQPGRHFTLSLVADF